jgi:hypothetical protein
MIRHTAETIDKIKISLWFRKSTAIPRKKILIIEMDRTDFACEKPRFKN